MKKEILLSAKINQKKLPTFYGTADMSDAILNKVVLVTSDILMLFHIITPQSGLQINL